MVNLRVTGTVIAMTSTDMSLHVAAGSGDDVRALLRDYEQGRSSVEALLDALADFPFDFSTGDHELLTPQWVAERCARDGGPRAFAWVSRAAWRGLISPQAYRELCARVGCSPVMLSQPGASTVP